MNKIFLTLTFLLIFNRSYSQTPISKSTKTIVENGQIFYIHTVEQGQTIFSITKAYGVSEQDLINSNPQIAEGLKIGHELKIFKSATPIDMSPALTDTITPTENGFIFHKVEQGETLFKILKTYNISLVELEKYNPGIDSNLKIGQFIKLPKTEEKIENKAPDKEQHIEKPAENLQKNQIVEKPKCGDAKPHDKIFKIGVMMPFYTQTESEIRTDNEYFMKSEENYQAFKFIQYYEGFLIALDSMKNLGFNAEIYVYDTKADSSVTKSITKKPEFSQLDLIIGPFFMKNLRQIVPKASANKTNVISPFSSANGLDAYSNLFVMEAAMANLWSAGIKYINDSLPLSHIYVLHSGKENELKGLNALKSAYSKSSRPDMSKFHIYSYKEGGFQNMLDDLKTNQANIIINLVDNEASISSFVRLLNQNREKYPMVLMGLEEQWSKYKTLEDDYLVNLRLTLLSSSFIDYRQANVQIFAHKFMNQYKTDPNPIAFKGYDESLYFMQLLFYYGNSFSKCINNLPFDGTQSQFHFSKTSAGKWVNTYGNVYQYFNFELTDKNKAVVPYVPVNP